MKIQFNTLFRHFLVPTISAIAITSNQLYPQNAKLEIFEHLNPDQGMSSYIAPCLIQDRTGYLWFGTYNGIDRYDGNRFTSYTHDPGNPNSISSGTVQALCEDKDGNLWIGSSLGLDKFERATGSFSHVFPHAPASGAYFSSYVLSLCEDTSGVLWIGTADGLMRFDQSSGEIRTFRHDSTDPRSISNNYVHSLLEDSRGSVWVGTGNGLDKLDRKTGRFIHYWQDPKHGAGTIRIEWNNSIEYSLSSEINSLYEDHSGMIWLCTNGEGLIEVDPKSGASTSFKHDDRDPQSLHSLTSDNIESVCQDHDGVYWVGTKSNGLITFNSQTYSFTHYYHDEDDPGSLSINLILAIVCERSGTVWITTFNGVDKINRKTRPFKQYNDVEHSWDRSFGTGASVITGGDGKLWVQMDNGKTLQFDPGTETFAPQFNSYRTGRSYIAEDDSGNIFMKSSEGGIYLKTRNGRATRITYPSGEEFHQQVYCIYAPSSNDTAWVGTLEGGVFSIDKRTKTISLIQSTSTSIKCVLRDSFGLLWAGTKDAGLIEYDPSQRTSVVFRSDANDPRSISGNSITTIYEDKKKDVWFGTDVGLNRYIRATRSFVHFTENEGLPSNLIFSIEGDSHGNLWFSTDNGITKFKPESGQITNYDRSYGFTSNRFYYTGCETRNGEIYFGGPGGLTRFQPDSIQDNPYIPPIVITSVRVFDKAVPFGARIQLPYSKNFLSFEFATLSFVSPERNQYAYTMEGVDKDWVYSGSRIYASYPNLPPGEYVFRVRGSNNDGIWNQAGTSIAIRIFPPWWRTTWAYLSYGLILMITLYGIRRYELKRIELKETVRMNVAILKERDATDEMKSRFFANISHEFRTPLTLILGPADNIASTSSDEKVIRDAGIIRRNAKRLLHLVNQLLDLSKLEAGRTRIQASRGNLVAFVRGLVASFESFSEAKNISLELSSERESIEMYFDKDKMTKILSNILSNALKFTPSTGTIHVSVGESDNLIELKVRDTGIGIPENEIPKVFDRFYQVDSSVTKEHEGTGIGLALTKELVELLHGKITIKSEPGLWTEVTLIFPLGRAHLNEEDVGMDENDDNPSASILEEHIPPEGNTKDVFVEETTPAKEEWQIILVVEDNHDMKGYIRGVLEKNYLIEEADDGEEGIRKAVEIIPDMIISDMMMPKLNGSELVKTLKNDERTSHVPIIILTAKAGQESKLEGLGIGADDYLTKPFDPKELQVRVKNLIALRRKLQQRFATIAYSEPAKGRRKISSIDEKFMTTLKEVIERHLSEEGFGMEDLGKEVGMSRMQIHRKMKALTGRSAGRYIRRYRLERARAILRERNENISEVAYALGFASPAYFTRCFREEFGYPPSSLRG